MDQNDTKDQGNAALQESGFPEPESGDGDPLRTACDVCGMVLHRM